MKQHNIFITEPDMEKLRQLPEGARNPASKDKEHLTVLEEELDRARLVSAGRVPADVVTMNSRVRMTDLDAGKEMIYTLVFRGMPIFLRARSRCSRRSAPRSLDTGPVT